MIRCPQCARAFDGDHRFCPYDGGPLGTDGDPLLGSRLLDQFVVREVIGAGATGTVYRAWQEPMERWVAVKVLHPELASDPAMLGRAAREARAVARLAHPGIVTVHATGSINGRPFLVMELVDGFALEDILVQGRPMKLDRALGIVRQVVSALAVSHAAGVVHRDLKPANIMLARHGRTDLVKVLDFGVAKLASGKLIDQSGALTADGAICGTPHYISPEQASGESPDQRADIYSLGVLLYRLVTGQLPFDGHPVAVLLGHVQEQPRPAEAINPEVDARLARVIDRCLAKDPAVRYQSADELGAALERVQRGRSPSWTELAPTLALPAESGTMPPSASLTAELPVRSGRRMLGVALAMMLACAIGATGSAMWHEQRGAAAAASHQPARVNPAPPAADPAAGEAREILEPDVISAPSGPERRAVVVGEGGYSMRLLMPVRMLIGVDYQFDLEVWDPDGEPIETPEMILTVDDPDANSRGIAARPAHRKGLYRFERTFARAGTHQLRVYPPAGGTTITVFVDIVEPGAADRPAVADGQTVEARS